MKKTSKIKHSDNKESNHERNLIWKETVKIFGIILLGALTVIFLSHLLDFFSQKVSLKGFSPFFIFFSVDPDAVRNYIGSFAEVITGLFGIIITVVAIIVNLSANRYTSKIIDLFIKDRLNIIILVVYAIICTTGIWVTNSVQHSLNSDVFFPTYEVLIYLGMVSFGVLIIVPYFFYVFDFLKPITIINKIQKQAFIYIDEANKTDNNQKLKSALIENLEQLSEICKGSLISADQSLGLTSLKAMNEILQHYIDVKDKQPFAKKWYLKIDEYFLGLNAPILNDLKDRRHWFEYKVFDVYESVLVHFLNCDAKITHQVAINATEIGTKAVEHYNYVIIDMIRRYFNTFLRRAIDHHQVQIIVYVLYQYYLFMKSLLPMQTMIANQLFLKIAEHFKYYGQFAALAGLDKALQDSAYFLRLINEDAYKKYGKESEVVTEMLNLFLTVDDLPEKKISEEALIGVRKHQAILASFYMQQDDTKFRDRILNDMRNETPKRLERIKNEILELDEENYFEIDNIGINPFFIDRWQKFKLIEFFGLFGNE